MKKLFRVLKLTGIFIGGLLIILISYVFIAGNKTFKAPYPEIKASTDSAMIERGRYLAYGPSHCASCHIPMEKFFEVDKGLIIPLSGGWEVTFPGFGTMRAPNLTPDEETGIGKLTDKEIARALRYGVSHKGKILFPFMPFQEMSNEDMTAIISFLRSQEPVKNVVEPTKYGFLAKALIAFGLFKPEGPKNTPPETVQKAASIEYGKYLAYHVANCKSCHTLMDASGKYIGKDFAGGNIFPDDFGKGFNYISPNLTPDTETGILSKWSEETFIARFKQGRIIEYSPMPWGAYSRMDSIDLSALYKYFMSLEPVHYKIEKTVWTPGEKLPKTK